MYVEEIEIENFRSFRKVHASFVHPDRQRGDVDFPLPKLRNVNLVLGLLKLLARW